MSCDHASAAFFATVAHEPGLQSAFPDPQRALGTIYETARNVARAQPKPRGAGPQVRLAQALDDAAERKTARLFQEMRGLGIKLPSHGSRMAHGMPMPRRASAHGFAAVYDALRATRGGGELPKLAAAVQAQQQGEVWRAEATGHRRTPEQMAIHSYLAQMSYDMRNYANDERYAFDSEVALALARGLRRRPFLPIRLRQAVAAIQRDPYTDDWEERKQAFAAAICEAAGDRRCEKCGRFTDDDGAHPCVSTPEREQREAVQILEERRAARLHQLIDIGNVALAEPEAPPEEGEGGSSPSSDPDPDAPPPVAELRAGLADVIEADAALLALANGEAPADPAEAERLVAPLRAALLPLGNAIFAEDRAGQAALEQQYGPTLYQLAVQVFMDAEQMGLPGITQPPEQQRQAARGLARASAMLGGVDRCPVCERFTAPRLTHTCPGPAAEGDGPAPAARRKGNALTPERRDHLRTVLAQNPAILAAAQGLQLDGDQTDEARMWLAVCYDGAASQVYTRTIPALRAWRQRLRALDDAGLTAATPAAAQELCALLEMPRCERCGRYTALDGTHPCVDTPEGGEAPQSAPQLSPEVLRDIRVAFAQFPALHALADGARPLDNEAMQAVVRLYNRFRRARRLPAILRAAIAALPTNLFEGMAAMEPDVRRFLVELRRAGGLESPLPGPPPPLVLPPPPTEPLEAQRHRWAAWRREDNPPSAPLLHALWSLRRDAWVVTERALYDGWASPEDQDDDCRAMLRHLRAHRDAILAAPDCPPDLAARLRALPEALPGPFRADAIPPEAANIADAYRAAMLACGHPRCTRCGQFVASSHRCPPRLPDLDTERAAARGQLDTLLPAAALGAVSPEGDHAALQAAFLGGMRALTDADAYEPIRHRAQALRIFFERAGVAVPPDLAQADAYADLPVEAEEQVYTFPATWGGYAAVYDALAARGAFDAPAEISADAVRLDPKQVPEGAVVYDPQARVVMLRVARPEGGMPMPYFMRLSPEAPGPSVLRLPGEIGTLRRTSPPLVLVREAPPLSEDAPRWRPADDAPFPAGIRARIAAARQEAVPMFQVRGLMWAALDLTGAERRAVVEEAVGVARQEYARSRDDDAFVMAAAVAALGGDMPSARFAVEVGLAEERDEAQQAMVYANAARSMAGVEHPNAAGAVSGLLEQALTRAEQARRSKWRGVASNLIIHAAMQTGRWDVAIRDLARNTSTTEKVRMFSAVARRGPPEIVPELLALARSIPDQALPGMEPDYEAAGATLSTLVARVPEAERAALAQEVMRLCAQESQPTIHLAEALAAVVPHLRPEQRRWAVDHLARAPFRSGLSTPVMQAHALTTLAYALGGVDRERAVGLALERVPPQETQTLAELYPVMASEQRARHFGSLLAAAREDTSPSRDILVPLMAGAEGAEREQVLALVASLDEDVRDQVTKMAENWQGPARMLF